jgi:cell division protein FtsB
MLGTFQIVSLSRQLISLLAAGGRLTKDQSKVEQLEEEREKLKRQLDYHRSQEFLEKEARDRLNLAKPEETVVVIPQELLDFYLPKDQDEETSQESKSNWLLWKEAFWGK